MTKSHSATQAPPRRSTRTRTKRPAESEAERSDEEAPKGKAAKKRVPAAKQQADAVEDKPASKRGRRKTQPAVAKQPNAAEPDLPKQAEKASKASKSAKQSGQNATQAATTQAETTTQGKSDSATAADQRSGKPAAGGGGSEPSGSKQSAAADPACPKAHTSTVAGEADVMLNQTNIGANNNKFYRMQVLREGSSEHWLWTRWGRVGDKGQTQLQGPFDADTGLREFKKKFRSGHVLHPSSDTASRQPCLGASCSRDCGPSVLHSAMQNLLCQASALYVVLFMTSWAVLNKPRNLSDIG